MVRCTEVDIRILRDMHRFTSEIHIKCTPLYMSDVLTIDFISGEDIYLISQKELDEIKKGNDAISKVLNG